MSASLRRSWLDSLARIERLSDAPIHEEASGVPPRALPPPASSAPPYGLGGELAAASKPPELSKRERTALEKRQRERDRERLEEKDRRYLLRWREQCEARGQAPGERPPAILPSVWVMCWAIVNDATGHAGRAALRWARDHYGGAFAEVVFRAAFAPTDHAPDAVTRWDWQDTCARRTVAITYLLLRQARLVPWGRDAFGRARLGLCVRGISRRAIAAAIALLNRAPVDVSTLSRADGYFDRLEAAGVIARVQLPAQIAEPWEVVRTVRGDRAYNRYWLYSPTIGVLKPQLHRSEDTALLNFIGWTRSEQHVVRARPVAPPVAAPPPD